ncbi:MAG: cellulase family glycosylhydrolase [Spirochaetales bacterium]|nr:cellulase family glycosylhydrolase [Spirochaetales bacterium]
MKYNKKKKNGFSRILSILFFCFIPIISLYPAELGDVNESGGIDIVDALLIAQYYVGLYPSNFNQSYADVDCDGDVDIVDALQVARYYVGLIDSFPCGTTPPPTSPPAVTMNFITRSGTRLYDGDREFRFVSVNIPNYFILEDRAATVGNKWHRVTEFEQRDACRTVKRLGGQVFRTYTFSVQGGVNVENNLAHITGQNGNLSYNEELFRDVDRGIAIAAEEGLRMYIPIIDNWEWFGGCGEFAAVAGGGDFWTSQTVKNKFKDFLTWLLDRTNTVNGRKYKDEPAIMAWELGNEIDKANDTWITEMAAHIKSRDPNHLIIDGGHKSIPQVSLSSPDVDIVTTHYTDGEIQNFTQRAASSGKPYIYGEYSTDSSVQNIVDTVISAGSAGCLIWSLRFRTGYGGFYFHQDFSGDSLQYPGFDSNERNIFSILRNGAYRIRGLSVPAEPVPPAPVLLPISSPNDINWQGSAGATHYIVQRSGSAGGNWSTLSSNVTDIGNTNYDGQLVARLPLYSDNTGNGTWYYRVIAVNGAGESEPSNVVSAGN